MSREIENHYRNLVIKHGDSSAAAQYSCRDSHFRRFAALIRIGDINNKNILDFGCGTASFADFLKINNIIPNQYSGIDVVNECLDIARNKYPQFEFYKSYGHIEDKIFDFIFVNGVFNNKRDNNRQFWQDTVKKLFDKCTYGVAFNLMSDYVDYESEDLFYESPLRAFDYIKKNITPYVSINHDYLPKKGSIAYEYTIFAYHVPTELDFKICAV